MKTEKYKIQMVVGSDLLPAVEQALRDRAHYITTEQGQEKPDFIIEIDETPEDLSGDDLEQWEELARFAGYTKVYFY